jgi:4-amino-4-deoxy-L-arabinose transferase-like glycosyltransferase
LPETVRRALDARLIIIAAIGLGAIVRVVIAVSSPLLPDEAYYWEWSRHLAAGYFDHPPAVAWLIAGGTSLFGATSLGVRLGTLLTGTAAIVCVVAIARRLGGDGAATRAAIILLCMPVATIGLAITTTDAPALLAVAVALLCIVLALEHAPGSRDALAWWVAAGGASGAGLLSKLTVGIVGAAIGVAMLAQPSLRRQLRTAGPWLAVVAAAVVAIPVIRWNAHHDWISLRFQLVHGLGAPRRGSILSRELSLLASQLGLVSPGIFILAVVAAVRATRDRDEGSPRQRADARFLLAVVGLVVFAFFIYSALRRPVEGNWPAPAFVALVPVLAASRSPSIARWWRASVAIGALLVAVALLQVAAPVLPMSARRDPVARAYGWRSLADGASRVRRDAAVGNDATAWLAADRYQDAAELAFCTRGNPRVFALNIGGRPNQYDLWPSFADEARVGDALVAVLDTGSTEAELSRVLLPYFASATARATIALTRGTDTVAVRRVWLFAGWHGAWPRKNPGGG